MFVLSEMKTYFLNIVKLGSALVDYTVKLAVSEARLTTIDDSTLKIVRSLQVYNSPSQSKEVK
ncbi:hypothetical protein J8L98_15280 [Pseudoalteromonas sp. MMG013]|uniref:hypothetical protein n=1 Tax=Pseudoalteromonas sp. MMG013 TaxID=2822687 RepID=UPI001B3719E9|nr:hypothetical protein [Pseudoalteromonas sp. MMG013]MBQ4863047.1 hypothetical protein [Pseudoalteromonas sp. MMG013]